MHNLSRWNLLATILVGVLALVLHAETASAAEGVPYSASNIPLSAGNPTFSIEVDLLTLPTRPQLRIFATPDGAHSNMTLEIEIPANSCPFFGGEDSCFLSWNSNSAPGPVEWVAPIYQCVPAPANEGLPNPECTLRVTATSFGSGGSPATFNLQIEGETRPVTGTVEAVVNIPAGGVSGDIESDRVQFITDAANFRWIYDDDVPDDDMVETFHPVSHSQLGRCEAQVGFDPDIFNPVPYTYTYVGSPSYVGFDCCTWRMDSPGTETTGSGQALFYVNLGLGAQPPDSDGDGFFDPCDNCVNVPNGPFLGTCVESDGTGSLTPCLSEQQCGPTEICSMAQEDNDFDPAKGLVCLPEPGAMTLLASGVLCLVALERRRRRSA